MEKNNNVDGELCLKKEAICIKNLNAAQCNEFSELMSKKISPNNRNLVFAKMYEILQPKISICEIPGGSTMEINFNGVDKKSSHFNCFLNFICCCFKRKKQNLNRQLKLDLNDAEMKVIRNFNKSLEVKENNHLFNQAPALEIGANGKYEDCDSKK